MMKIVSRLVAAVAIATSLAAMAQKPAMPAVAGAESVKVTATVEAIDQSTRMVTLRGNDGVLTTFKAGPEVKNLAQVKKGDVVTAQYVHALALELKKGGDGIRSSTETPASARAKPGEMPAGAVANQTVIVANVIKVDAKNKSVTVLGPEGRTLTLDVKDPAVLSEVKVGDQIEATYTEALMMSVSRPAKK
jgi:Cu/Ag efflux protein CusF